jgi:hypothetical protein
MSSGSTDTSTSTQRSEVATAALPYVKQALGQASALSAQPYQAYQGERVAQFTPLQQQAFQGAYSMSPAWQGDTASDIAGYSAQNAMNAGQNYAMQATNPYATQAYMSPYQQGVTDVAKREAMRDYGIQQLGRNAAATRAGAFGGSRQGIENAEAARNLGTKLSDIQTQGLQSAYDRAQQNMQYGANLGLQGSQAAAAAANTLAGIGQQQFQQGVDISKLQNLYGTQQQQGVQAGLDTAYQQFQEQQQYPYKNIAFMSDLYRGLPLSNVTQTQSTPSASLLSQLAGAGTGIYGGAKALGMLAKGGSVNDVKFSGLSGAGLYKAGKKS